MAEPEPSAGPDWRTLHLWQIQPVRDALVGLMVFGVLWLGYRLSIVTVPILLALALAYLFEPIVRALTRRFRWLSREGVALAIIALGVGLVIVPLTLGLTYAVFQGVRVVATIGDNAGNLVESVRAPTLARQQEIRQNRLPPAWRSTSDALYRLRCEVEDYKARQAAPAPAPPAEPPPNTTPTDGGTPIEHGAGEKKLPGWKLAAYEAVDGTAQWIRDNAKELGQRAIGGSAAAISAAVGAFTSIGMFLFTLFLTAFFFFFFSTGYGRVLAFWERLIPERKRGRAVELLVQMDRVIAGFIRGRLTIAFCLGVWMTIGYFLIGVPAPLLMGPAVGAMFLIPYVSGTSIPVACALMWLEPSGPAWQQQWWWIVFAPVGLFMTAQALDDYVLSPRIQGKATGMDAPAIVFASISGGALAGIYGLLLAIPVAACIKILLREVFWPRVREWTQGRATDVLPIGETGRAR